MMAEDRMQALAQQLMNTKLDELGALERRVLSHIARDAHISRDLDEEFSEKLTWGQRLADQVALFGGSWTFISLFAVFLIVWAAVNSVLLGEKAAFDPYPYIFLNLMLSMLAAIQAPIIMMSQNRQSQKDRLDARHDYEVNLKAELDIMALHDKLDDMRTRHLTEMVRHQEEQIRLLRQLLGARGAGGAPTQA
ncbi:DUF1003 domain-containing protein [Vineibacter terrae]|uniref:DUF1003 domain-containing protein n=1 Tax=Vineibacter terrae TaxID=2586908 RepID=A0A5C8PV00_9HYPH|nr:DUF1003 domain-containing protein [Vineibacter terrae]